MNDWIANEVSTGSTERVRGAVLGRIRRRRMARRAAGAVTVVAALAIVFWPATPELETLTYLPPPPPAAPAWVPPPKPVVSKPAAPAIHMAKATSRPAERITIYTDDPDVVIVLVADGGES